MDTRQLHQNPLFREELIRDYLLKRLDADTVEAFESHCLSCEECFEELRLSQMLMAGLDHCKGDLRRVGGASVLYCAVGCMAAQTCLTELRRGGEVVVVQFAGPGQLTRESFELEELKQVFQQKDTKVLIDLGRVTRIDSAGLGQLISCYTHAVKNQGMLKLLNPTAQVERLLRLTKIDSVVEIYNDERQALQSFEQA